MESAEEVIEEELARVLAYLDKYRSQVFDPAKLALLAGLRRDLQIKNTEINPPEDFH